MQSILEATVQEARATGQRKLTPAHLYVLSSMLLSLSHKASKTDTYSFLSLSLLFCPYSKRAVYNNDTFDFLKDIVEEVKDEGGDANSSEPKSKKRKTTKNEDSD